MPTPKLDEQDEQQQEIQAPAPVEDTASDVSDQAQPADDNPNSNVADYAPRRYLSKTLKSYQDKADVLTKQVATDNKAANTPTSLTMEQKVAGALIPLLTAGAGFLIKGKEGLSAGGQAGGEAAGKYFADADKDAGMVRSQAKADQMLHSQELKETQGEVDKLNLEGVRGDAQEAKAAAKGKKPPLQQAEIDAMVSQLRRAGGDDSDITRLTTNPSKETFDDTLKAIGAKNQKGSQDRQDRNSAAVNFEKASKYMSRRVPGTTILDGYEPDDKAATKAKDAKSSFDELDTAYGSLANAVKQMKEASRNPSSPEAQQAYADALRAYSSSVLATQKNRGLGARLTEYGINLEKGLLPVLPPNMGNNVSDFRKYMAAEGRNEDPERKIQLTREEARGAINAKLKDLGYSIEGDTQTADDKTRYFLKHKFALDDGDIEHFLPSQKSAGSSSQPAAQQQPPAKNNLNNNPKYRALVDQYKAKLLAERQQGAN